MVFWKLFLLLVLIFESDQLRAAVQIPTSYVSAISGGLEAPYSYLTFDQSQEFSAVRSSSNWQKQTWPPLYYSHEYWIRFNLVNDLEKSVDMIFEEQWGLNQEVELFLVKDGQIVFTGRDGESTPIERRPFDNRFPTFKVELDPGIYEVFFKYKNNNVPGSRLRLIPAENFSTKIHQEFSLLGAIFGSIALMVIYNFCIFLILREKAYLFYSIYISSFLAFEGILSGYFYSLGLNYHFMWNNLLLLFASSSMFFVRKFTHDFLQIENGSIQDKLGTVLSYLLIGANLCQFVSFRVATHLIVLLDFYIIGWVLFVSVSLLHRRQFIVYIYGVAWGILAFGDLLTASYYVGLLPPSFLTKWGLLIGTVIEAALISLGLAWKVHVLRRKALEAEASKNKLELAKTIQESIVKTGSNIEELNLKSLYISAEETGGDWLYVSKSQVLNRIYVIVGDVTDHGIGSAIITGLVRGSVETTIHWSEQHQLTAQETILEIAGKLNIILGQTGSQLGRLMTANMFILDLDEDKGIMLNAGHQASFVKQPDQKKAQVLFPRGNILGFEPEAKFETKQFDFNPGTKILSYTDGVVENSNTAGRHLKKKDVYTIFNQNNSISEVYEEIWHQGSQFWNVSQLADDITLVILERRLPPSKSTKSVA